MIMIIVPCVCGCGCVCICMCACVCVLTRIIAGYCKSVMQYHPSLKAYKMMKRKDLINFMKLG